MRERLQEKSTQYLEELQIKATQKRRRTNYQHPNSTDDRLFLANYAHKHRTSCSICLDDTLGFCEAATKASCTELGCDATKLVARNRRYQDSDFQPEIFIGRVGSGNTVVKSGADRDRIAAQYDLIAFEMEGAGAWDQVPCIVVKGICDYGDNHKNKGWQAFAAATAASVAKAMLGRYAVSNRLAAASLVQVGMRIHSRISNRLILTAPGSTQADSLLTEICKTNTSLEGMEPFYF